MVKVVLVLVMEVVGYGVFVLTMDNSSPGAVINDVSIFCQFFTLPSLPCQQMSASFQTLSPHVSKSQHFLEKSPNNFNKKNLMSANLSIWKTTDHRRISDILHKMGDYSLRNRVEHQKLNKTTAELPFGWVFGVAHRTPGGGGGDGGRRYTDDDVLGTNSLPASAEGRVEHQNLNQTAALLSFGWVFDLNQTAAVVWLSIWCSTRFRS